VHATGPSKVKGPSQSKLAIVEAVNRSFCELAQLSKIGKILRIAPRIWLGVEQANPKTRPLQYFDSWLASKQLDSGRSKMPRTAASLATVTSLYLGFKIAVQCNPASAPTICNI
jgi:hypothetical protein